MSNTKPTENSSPQGSRGRTCLNCRRRKIKCDGNRPICDNCSRSNGMFDDCEYPTGGPSQTQLLEEKIRQTKLRICELENPDQYSALLLHHPYLLESSGSTEIPTTGLDSPVSTTNRTTSMDDFWEPGVNFRSTLLTSFASQGHLFGFFLSLNRFRESLLLPLPLGSSSRPAPSLVSAVYLWGIHLSPSVSTPYEEVVFLKATLRFLAEDLAGSHPHKIVHAIQAGVLLSYFYLKKGKLLEGNYHANSALSLCLSIGLHHIRSSQVRDSSTDALGYSSPSELSGPADSIEEGERIDGFWAVLILNNYWVVIQQSHSMSHYLIEDHIDTPWPMDVSDYETQGYLPGESDATVRRFLEGESVDGISKNALRAKATILLEQATTLHLDHTYTSEVPAHLSRNPARRTSGPTPRWSAFFRLDNTIDKFRSGLPLFDSFDTTSNSKYDRIVTQMLVHGAAITLHMPFYGNLKESEDKCLFSARSIAWLTNNLLPGDLPETMPETLPLLDPIVGVLWTIACEVLMSRILDQNSADSENDDTVAPLETLVRYMTRFSETSDLLKLLVARFQERYSTLG